MESESNELRVVRAEFRRSRILWGVLLLVGGALMLLERFGPWPMLTFSRLWPVFILVYALARALDGRPGGALMLAGLGAWALAVEFGWYGFTWGNSWSLALVAVGLGIVVRALTGEDRRRLRRLGVRLD
ncbi:MAG TPA: DUF5668 domain-containing protein [Terriglobales bacterium]|nr:DUF5668 domain-containing protein [Terriglobales bacterium]